MRFAVVRLSRRGLSLEGPAGRRAPPQFAMHGSGSLPIPGVWPKEIITVKDRKVMKTEPLDFDHGLTGIAEILARGMVRLRQMQIRATALAPLATEKPGNLAQNQLELRPETALSVTHGLTDPENSVTRRHR
jgi:hypothetical protein